MWWYVVIIAAVVIVLGVVLARRGSTGGTVGRNTPGIEAHGYRRGGDSGPGGGSA